MTTDTPATPTPEGLARALAMIDGHVFGDAVVVGIEGDIARAVFAVARLCALATGAQAGEGAGGS